MAKQLPQRHSFTLTEISESLRTVLWNSPDTMHSKGPVASKTVLWDLGKHPRVSRVTGKKHYSTFHIQQPCPLGTQLNGPLQTVWSAAREFQPVLQLYDSTKGYSNGRTTDSSLELSEIICERNEVWFDTFLEFRERTCDQWPWEARGAHFLLVTNFSQLTPNSEWNVEHEKPCMHFEIL